MISYLLRTIEKKLTYISACKVRNIAQKVSGRNTRFGYDKASELFFATDMGINRYFGERERGFALYTRGFKYRSEQLIKSYCIENISIETGDTVVDCGANFGDLELCYKVIDKKINYIGFEPGPREFSALQKNIKSQNLYNLGLGDKDEKMYFYLQSASADSSFIEPLEYTEKLEVDVVTLDNVMIEKSFPKYIKLFKLEAEGYEPEILEGATNFIKRCRYIAIDGGPERGIKSEETFSFQAQFLIEHGFKLISLNFDRGAGLFINKNIDQ